MSITHQIITQTDILMKGVAEYRRKLAEEEMRHKLAYQKIKDTAATQEKQITDGTSKDIEILQKDLADHKSVLRVNMKYLDDFTDELSTMVPRSKVINIPVTNTSALLGESDIKGELYKIGDNSLVALLKKLFSLMGYAPNSTMAANLYARMDATKALLKQEVDELDKKYRASVSKLKTHESKIVASINSQCKQDLQTEMMTHQSKLREIEYFRTTFDKRKELADLKSIYSRAAKTLGERSGDWQHYTPVKEKAKEELLLGLILLQNNMTDLSNIEREMLKKIPGFQEKVNGYTVPLSTSFNAPLLLCTTCDTDDVKMAAVLYQTIIARMIRYIPPKQFQAVFIDPVDRGVSLGQLIRLNGEGTSQVCEYYLSPREITEKMEQLTQHVDQVCRKLTEKNCEDVYEYNKGRSKGCIPYTALVIHDFPNGFDSSALSNLQVILNKSRQCGISVLISMKKQDFQKMDNRKQKEYLDMKASVPFLDIVIDEKKAASVNLESTSYRFRPAMTDIQPSYLEEINKVFTYREEIDNSFSSFLAASKPEYKDATRGLNIPFAVDEDGEIVELKIGYDLSAYGFISGGVGSGKSTLLHMLITSAIMHYRPEDLELWLVDYKETEFAFYMKNCPPHVKYVVADNSSEISFSILDEIDEELKRRREAFTRAQAKDFVEYRESSYGQRNPLPRLLIIIDEFHRMAQAAQSETDYKTALENIFAEARSHGVSLLLCDQQMSNGLGGLSQKSRDLISVRIALRNKPEEIRETLAAESSQITTEVRKKILDTSSGVKGSAIYKYEVENTESNFENELVFKRCRGIFAATEDRVKVVAAINQKNQEFKRDHVFYSGAERQRMSIPQIEKFEKQYPQKAVLGERFYLGTPLGIQPCFYLNLKAGESGENVLLVGSNVEKRISILKAVLSCAKRYGYQTKLLVSRTSQLYKQGREFFQNISMAEVITTFPEICQCVGIRANQIQDLYSEEEMEDDFETSTGTDNKELLIFVGADEIYSQMDSSRLSQREAWTVTETKEAEVDQRGVADSFEAHTSVDAWRAAHGKVRVEEKSETVKEDENLFRELSMVDDLMKSLGLDDEEDTIPEKYAGGNGGGIRGYNATRDMGRVFAEGWKIGINSIMILDRGTMIGKMREVKLDGNFNHRIGLVMSPDEAQFFMSKTKVMKTLIDQDDEISAVYEYMGGREQCFRPYRFE